MEDDRNSMFVQKCNCGKTPAFDLSMLQIHNKFWPALRVDAASGQRCMTDQRKN